MKEGADMTEKITNNKAFILLLVTGAVYFFLKFITPVTGPVLVAVLFVTIFGPLLKKMQEKLHLHRQVGAVLLLTAAFLLVAGLFAILFFWIAGSLPEWLKNLDALQEQARQLLHFLCETLGGLVGIKGANLEKTIWNYLDERFTLSGNSPLVPRMLDQSLQYAKFLAAFGGFLVTFLISSVLLAKDYDDIMNRLLDREEYHVILEVICGVIRYIATFVKAQAVIMTVIGALCAVTLGIFGIPNGVLWGILAGVLDALPFIGTGVVLMPMTVLQIIQGNYVKAAVCVILYVVCIFARELLEPRLIGHRMGIPPIAVLLSLYAGIQLFGVGGIIKGPLGFVLISQTYRSIRRTSLQFGGVAHEESIEKGS